MKKKFSILTFIFVTIFLFSTQNANAYPNQYLEVSKVYIGSGDGGNGYFQPYVGNGNDYPVNVKFDIYCLDDQGRSHFVRSYSIKLDANSGTVNLQNQAVPKGCFWIHPKNVRVQKAY